MKNRRWGVLAFSLQILLFLFLNLGGDYVISRLNWPIWLDSVGTVLCAYAYGPLCGAIVGAAGNLLMSILYDITWLYSLISIVIAVTVGIATRRKKLDTLLNTLTTVMILTGIVVAAAYPINLLSNHGSTGNNWGDAVISFLAEQGIPRWAGLLIGELYVELLDKLTILVVLFLTVRLYRLIRSWIRRRNDGGKTKAAEISALILAVGMCLSGLTGGTVSGRAEEAGLPDASRYSDYVQTVYSTTNGLPCGEANDIAMTGDGILWIGTYAGLYRYNGRSFKWMDSYDSIRNVNCLYVDEEGRLWVGTNDNGLSIMIEEQVVNVIDQSSGLPANSVKSIIKSSDGYYYIGTTGSMQVLTLNCGLKRAGVLTEISYAEYLAADENGNVAAVTNEGVLFLMRQGGIVSSRRLTDRQTIFTSCSFDPKDGTLLAATSGNEIIRFRISGSRFEMIDRQTYAGLQNIKSLHFLENGEMFICADNGIAYVDAEGNYQPINTNDFNNSIDNMIVDYQGNLWFTSSRLGLLRLASSNFRDIYSVAGMKNRVVNTIVNWNGNYYIGTDKGMDAFDLSGQHQVKDELTERFAGIRIRCMIVDQENHLWVCTYGNGLVERTPEGEEFLYNQENGAFGNRARAVKQLRDGTVLAAGDTGISFIRNNQVETTLDRSEKRISSMVLTITEMPDGSILAGTDGNGLAIIRDRQIEKILTRADGLSSEVILRTIADPATGGVFLVTSNGLCYLDEDGNIRQLENFPYYNNYDIWFRGTDEIFVLSSAGIFIVNRDELFSGKKEISYELLDARQGLTGSLTANAWVWYNEESRELFLPCDTGVFAINTDHLFANSGAFRMKVNRISMDGEAYRIERNIATKISRDVNRLEIRPEVINYSIYDPYVGYMLEGFDTDWTIVPQNSLGSIVYTNLPTGDYTFRLAVFDNNQENILVERTYELTKPREMYDNNWFIFYILSVPMFTVFWITWLQVKRREEKMQAELEAANRQIEMGKQTVIAIARTVDAKDERTSEHSKRVAIYSGQIAEAIGLDEKQCQDIIWAAQMHDIGKIAIPDRILNKEGRLTDEEYALMKSHTSRGAEILKDFTLLDHVIEGAQYHHERYDGRGYPLGLKGEEIPLYARIIGVADAFDAMTANRVYRKQMDFSYVVGELEKGKGTQFDPQFVDVLLKLINEHVIDLNKIYHVSVEDSERAEKEAAEERAIREGKTTGERIPEQGGQA